MKPLIFTSLFFFVVAAAFSEDTEETPQGPGRFEISMGLALGTLVQGTQYDNLHDGFKSPPTQYSYGALQADLRVFPLKILGLELASDFFGVTSVRFGGFGTTLLAYNLTVYSVGPVFRWNYPVSEVNTISFFLGGGITYNSFAYADDYVSLFPSNWVFYTVTPEIGFYGKVGVAFYLARPFFVAGEVEYMEVRDRIETSGIDFDGGYLKLNGRVGMDF